MTNNCYSADTVVLLDWDDTLFPTSSHFWDIPTNIVDLKRMVNQLNSAICKTLIEMIQLFGSNNIYIVTNGSPLWIAQCTMKLIKLSNNNNNNFMYLINLYNIPIISSKDLYSLKYPKNYLKWKELKFKQIICECYSVFRNKKANNHSKQFTVVSIGDSIIEYDASKNVVDSINKENHNLKQNSHEKILLHRIKLLKHPSIKQLINEHALLKLIAVLFKTEINEINIDYEIEMKYFNS